MAYEKVVAAYDTAAHAQSAVAALRAGGFADAFKKIYKPAQKSSFSFKPSKVQIRGEEVNLFTA